MQHNWKLLMENRKVPLIEIKNFGKLKYGRPLYVKEWIAPKEKRKVEVCEK